jgi:hypothetical protein
MSPANTYGSPGAAEYSLSRSQFWTWVFETGSATQFTKHERDEIIPLPDVIDMLWWKIIHNIFIRKYNAKALPQWQQI